MSTLTIQSPFLKALHLHKAIILVLLGTLLFSLKPVLIKLTYAAGATPDTLLMLRMAISLPIYIMIGVYMFALHPPNPTTTSTPLKMYTLTMIAGIMGYFVASYLDLQGLALVSANVERLLVFTFPAFVMLISVVVGGKRITIQEIGAFSMTWVGIAVFLIFSDQQKLDVSTQGVILIIGSAFCFAIFMYMSQSLSQQLGSILFTCTGMTAASTAIIMYGVTTMQMSSFHINQDIFILAFIIATVSTVIPSFLIAEGVKQIGSTKTSIIGSAGPAATVVFAYLLLDEQYTFIHFIGMLITISGILLLKLKK